MKRKWAYFAVAGVVLALAVAYGVLFFLIDREQSGSAVTAAETEDERNPNKLEHPIVFSVFGTASMTAMTVNDVRYERRKGIWVSAANPQYPLDQGLLEYMARAFTEMQSDYRASDMPGDLLYGLADGEARIVTLEGEGDARVTYRFGEYEPTSDAYYFSATSADFVYLVPSMESYLSKTVFDYLVLDPLTSVSTSEIRDVKLTAADGHDVYYSSGIDVSLQERFSFLGAVDISPSAVASYQPTSEELHSFGLDTPITATLTYEADSQERTFVCRLGHYVRGTDGIYRIYLQIDRIVYLTYLGSDVSFLPGEITGTPESE